jgi:hypothetical protein
MWTGFMWLRIGTTEHGNEPSGSIKGRELSTSSVTISFSRRTPLHGVSQTPKNKPIFQKSKRKWN